jgi:hypothetical protein
MSFGFGVGDVIAILDKAKKLRDRFADAPAQFKAISTEYVCRISLSSKLTCSKRVSNLTGVLREIETLLPQHDLADWQEKQLRGLLEECRNVVITVNDVVNQNHCLGLSTAHGIRGKAQRTWKRVTWEPKDIGDLRARMALNTAYLGLFNQSLTRYILFVSLYIVLCLV